MKFTLEEMKLLVEALMLRISISTCMDGKNLDELQSLLSRFEDEYRKEIKPSLSDGEGK